jgi:DNA polymerase-3 subunit delta
VRAFGMHLARLRQVLARGSPSPEAAKQAGVFWKEEAEFLRQARAWNLAALDAVQPQILAADRACKRAASPDRLIAERLALALAAEARRLGL